MKLVALMSAVGGVVALVLYGVESSGHSELGPSILALWITVIVALSYLQLSKKVRSLRRDGVRANAAIKQAATLLDEQKQWLGRARRELLRSNETLNSQVMAELDGRINEALVTMERNNLNSQTNLIKEIKKTGDGTIEKNRRNLTTSSNQILNRSAELGDQVKRLQAEIAAIDRRIDDVRDLLNVMILESDG